MNNLPQVKHWSPPPPSLRECWWWIDECPGLHWCYANHVIIPHLSCRKLLVWMFFPTWPCGILFKWFTRASVKMESEVENRCSGRSLPVQGWRCLRVWLGWVHRAAESTDLCEVYYCRSEYLKLKTRPPSLHNCFYIQLHCTCYIFSCSFHSCIPVIFFCGGEMTCPGACYYFWKIQRFKV